MQNPMKHDDQKVFSAKIENTWNVIAKILQQGVGVFLAITAISTGIEFSLFVRLLQQTLHTSAGIAHGMGIVILVLEFGSGVALFLQKFPRLGSFTSLGVLGFLMLLHFLRTVTQRATEYHTIGFLHVFLSDSAILLLFLLACDVLIVCAPRFRRNATVPSLGVILITVVVLVFFNVLLIKEYNRFSSQFTRQSDNSASLLERLFPSLALNEHSSVLFLLHYSDFNCPPCLESVLELSYRLVSVLPPQDSSRVFAFMSEDRVMFNQERVEHWKKANEFPFRVTFVPESIFVQFQREKSSIVVLQHKKVTYERKVPLTQDEILTITNFLK